MSVEDHHVDTDHAVLSDGGIEEVSKLLDRRGDHLLKRIMG
jgi:hypothetical protein